jgi:hypothetical protein
VAIGEMLRVLRHGGTIAFSTWPPEFIVGRMFTLSAKYLPPPPQGVPPTPMWGDPNIVRQRLGSAVTNIHFDRERMTIPALSPAHQRAGAEKSAGAVVRLVTLLQQTDPAKLEEFRREYEALVSEYFEDNLVRQDYLITRATKV